MRISDWSSDVCSSDLCASESRCLCPDFRDRLSDLAGCWWVKPRRGKSYPQGGLVLIYGLKSRVTGFWRLRKILNIIVKSAIFWPWASTERSEEHTSELQSLMRISYAVLFLQKTMHGIPQFAEKQCRRYTPAGLNYGTHAQIRVPHPSLHL